MRIVLTGVETNNKGAELMLYAILQEIERKDPNADIYISPRDIPQGLDYVKTPLKLRYWPYERIINKSHINSILYRLHLPQLLDSRAVSADYFFDGSGFRFSDQCKLWGTKPEWWEKLLHNMHKNGSKIVFLPQAFGPVAEEPTKRAIKVLGLYSDIIMPREGTSYEYLKDSALVDMKKVRIFTDFTSLVEGVFPTSYEHLKGGVCIIPNVNMIEKGGIGFEEYLNLISSIAIESKNSGHPVYFLNHEGQRDSELCYKCKESIDCEVEIVTSLNALEVKGLISSAYIVITSRFHGLASSLNSGIPSLATSWSHKYEELFKDYGLDNDFVLPLQDNKATIKKVKDLLMEENNKRVRQIIERRIPRIKAQTHEMWDLIWSL